MQDSVNIDTSNAHCGLEIPCLGAPSGREAENCMFSRIRLRETSHRPRAPDLNCRVVETGTSQAQNTSRLRLPHCRPRSRSLMTACRAESVAGVYFVVVAASWRDARDRILPRRWFSHLLRSVCAYVCACARATTSSSRLFPWPLARAPARFALWGTFYRP